MDVDYIDWLFLITAFVLLAVPCVMYRSLITQTPAREVGEGGPVFIGRVFPYLSQIVWAGLLVGIIYSNPFLPILNAAGERALSLKRLLEADILCFVALLILSNRNMQYFMLTGKSNPTVQRVQSIAGCAWLGANLLLYYLGYWH